MILGTKQAQKENFWLSKIKDRDQRRSRPKMGAQASSYRKSQHLKIRFVYIWCACAQHAFRIFVCQVSIPPTKPFKSFCPFAPVRPFLGAIFNFEFLSSLLDLGKNILYWKVLGLITTVEKITAKIESSA